jgi:hypothetical protein
MIGHRLRRAALPALLAAMAALGGCGTTVAVLPESLTCPVGNDVLDKTCDRPVALADGASFQDLLKAGIDDRNALRQCELRRQELADAMRRCNRAIDDYMVRIREINKANAAKP